MGYLFKKALIVTVLILIGVFEGCVFLATTIVESYAQRVTPCGYIIPPRQPRLQSSFKSVYEATQVVNTMKDVIKWQENFQLKEQNGIQNAYATMSGGQRWIVYDNKFLEDIDAYSKTSTRY